MHSTDSFDWRKRGVVSTDEDQAASQPEAVEEPASMFQGGIIEAWVCPFGSSLAYPVMQRYLSLAAS